MGKFFGWWGEVGAKRGVGVHFVDTILRKDPLSECSSILLQPQPTLHDIRQVARCSPDLALSVLQQDLVAS